MRVTGSNPFIDGQQQVPGSGLSLLRFGRSRCRNKKEKRMFWFTDTLSTM